MLQRLRWQARSVTHHSGRKTWLVEGYRIRIGGNGALGHYRTRCRNWRHQDFRSGNSGSAFTLPLGADAHPILPLAQMGGGTGGLNIFRTASSNLMRARTDSSIATSSLANRLVEKAGIKGDSPLLKVSAFSFLAKEGRPRRAAPGVSSIYRVRIRRGRGAGACPGFRRCRRLR